MPEYIGKLYLTPPDEKEREWFQIGPFTAGNDTLAEEEVYNHYKSMEHYDVRTHPEFYPRVEVNEI